MVRSDIFAGLKNALDRGESLQKAKKVLINSGYDAKEVEEVAFYITGGTGETPQDFGTGSVSADYEDVNIKPPKTTSKTEIIILVLFLLVLIILLATSFFFRNEIIEFLKDII